MSYNGTGIYTLPGAQLINGEVVSATENNQFRNDVATALNTAWTRDGQAPATSNIPMANHKFTGLLPGTENGDSVCYEQVTSDVDITGGTIDGAVIGASNPDDATFNNVTVNTGFTSGFPVAGIVETTEGGFKFPDGTIQTSAAFYEEPGWTYFTTSGTFIVPNNVNKIRAYAIGAGGAGGTSVLNVGAGGGGGGGGCAFGDIAVSPGDSITVNISSGVATVTKDGTNLLVANNGSNGAAGNGTRLGGAGGTATKDASVSNGGAYTGGSGGKGGYNYSGYAAGGGGGSTGSPLGNGYPGGDAYDGGSAGGGGGGGIGGAGGNGGVTGGPAGAGGGGGGGAGGRGANATTNILANGGGAGGAATDNVNSIPGVGRSFANRFADPMLRHAVFGSIGSWSHLYPIFTNQGPGAGGSGCTDRGNAGDFGGGGGRAGLGGFMGGCGGGAAHPSYGGGAGGADYNGASGSGGGAIVLIYV